MATPTEPTAHGRVAGVAHGPLPPERVLQRLCSPETLRHCIPGAKAVRPDGEERFAVQIAGSLGPFAAHIDGTLSIAPGPEANQRSLRASGRGGDASTGEIAIRITVDAADDGCRLVYEGSLTLTDGAAAAGDRIVETLANMLGRLFFDRLLEPAEPKAETSLADDPGALRHGLRPQIWVPGLCVALLVLVLAFRL